MHIIAISGSLRAQSSNRLLLKAFADNIPAGMTFEIYDNIGAHTIFNPDFETIGVPDIIADFIERVQAADGMVIACPEYAHGIPGGLKNALDWLVSDIYLPGKPVMLVHGSTRNIHCRAHLTEVLKTMSLNLYPGPDYACHLVGKDPDTITALLDLADERQIIVDCLINFRDFASGADSAKM